MSGELLLGIDVVALSRELVGARDGPPLAGVCVSGLGPCLLPCDAELRPLRGSRSPAGRSRRTAR